MATSTECLYDHVLHFHIQRVESKGFQFKEKGVKEAVMA